MSTCRHGVPLPLNPKYGAQDVCSICRGLPPNQIATALMSDDYTDLSEDELRSILEDEGYDHIVKDPVRVEFQSRLAAQEASEDSDGA